MAVVQNQATRARIFDMTWDNPKKGGCKYAAEGVYTHGQRSGQRCMAKWFRKGPVYDDDSFFYDIKIVEQAQRIIDAFNDDCYPDSSTSVVWIAHPETVQMSSGRGARHGQKFLLEPFIDDFQKFISIRGRIMCENSSWCQMLQALSHFSYHKTGGLMVLSDLQGGVVDTRRRQGVVLTDPAIHSRDCRFGSSDLGEEGIMDFFSRHTCNGWCEAHWTKPRASK